jgi:hypothetical protein
MMISNSKLTSDVGTTDVYSEIELVCTNAKCPNFAGNDMKKPKKVHKEKLKAN